MEIRHSNESDIRDIMCIYSGARRFMAEHGNPHQWGDLNWPPKELILSDIADKKSYVCIHNDRIVGTFFFDSGSDIEPTYRVIEGGTWSSDTPYGVIHRIASSGTVRGVGQFCIEWALQKCWHIRIDTHADNTVMRNLLKKMGFSYRGIIYIKQDNSKRLAYEKII